MMKISYLLSQSPYSDNVIVVAFNAFESREIFSWGSVGWGDENNNKTIGIMMMIMAFYDGGFMNL